MVNDYLPGSLYPLDFACDDLEKGKGIGSLPITAICLCTAKSTRCQRSYEPTQWTDSSYRWRVQDNWDCFIAGFNSNREEEYIEVIKAGDELLHEIDEESKTEDFHFADLEENEKHLQRVKELLDSVKNRDYFGSPLQIKATELIEDCRSKFEEFSHEVYSREGIEMEDKKLPLYTGKKRMERYSVNKRTLADKVTEIVSNLTGGVLEIDNRKVGELPQSVALELEFKEQKKDKSLEIRLAWTSSTRGKKP
jgi:hypothetical protein